MWVYRGDVNIEYGGWFLNDEGPSAAPDYVNVVKVTPASAGGGHDNVFLIERGSVYMPLDDIKKMRSIMDVVGMQVNDDCSFRNDYYPADGTYAFQSTEWRTRYLEACDAYHGIDSPDTWVVRVGGKDKYGMDHGFLVDQEPDYKLRRNADLKRFIEREFCN